MTLPKSLTTVTTFSKILALVLFITLPIFGFWLGMEYQKITEPVTSPIDISSEPVSTPTPTVDETANWKTYRNEEYGFEFEYPGDWTLQEISNPDLPYIVHKIILQGISVEIYKQFSVKKVPEDKIITSEQIMINGIEGTYNRHNADGPYQEVIVPYQSKTYRLILDTESDEQVFDHILSTFRFTNENSELSCNTDNDCVMYSTDNCCGRGVANRDYAEEHGLNMHQICTAVCQEQTAFCINSVCTLR